MTGKIFISYRRADTEGYAGRIYDRLRTHFSDNEIFMDVDDIEPGEDFVLALETAVGDCDVLIALIGRQWLHIKDAQGDRRLDNPNDFVRLEIAAALKREIRVIPVLLGGTSMPRARDLPDVLKPLSRRNALEIRHNSFGLDIGKLQRAVAKCLDSLRPAPEKKTRPAAKPAPKTPAKKKTAAVPSPALAVELSAAPNPADMNTEIIWTATIRNPGNATAAELTLIHQRTILADEFDLAPGEQRVFTFSRTYADIGEHTEKVSLFGSGLHEEARGFIIVQQAPGFDLQLAPNPKTAAPGQPITWTLSVLNDGGADLHQVMARRGRKLLEDPFDLPMKKPRQITYALRYAEAGKHTEKVTVTAIADTGERLRRQAEARVKVRSANRMTLTRPLAMELIRIPAGEFLMGSDKKKDEAAYDDELPQHRLHLPEYFIGKTPVTNEQYRVFVKGKKHSVPFHWKNGKIPSGKEKHPVVNVTRHDAIAFCRWLSEQTGKTFHLPSEAEWEKAASWAVAPGSGGAKGGKRIYPWGNTWDKAKCNTSESGIGGTTPVGKYSPAGDSPCGCVDMAGNVWEWTRSLWREYPYDPADGRENLDADDKVPRVVRGGSWHFNHGFARSAYRGRYNPDLGDDLYGFRVVAVAVSP